MFVKRLNVLSVVWLLKTGWLLVDVCQKTKRIVSGLNVGNWRVDDCQKTEHIASSWIVDNWKIAVS